MNEIKQLFVDYIEGRIDTEEFISKIDSDEKYLLRFKSKFLKVSYVIIKEKNKMSLGMK